MRRLVIATLVFLFLGAVVALGAGRGALGPSALLQVLLTGPGLALDRVLVWDVRLPRVIAAVLAGASLAVAGALTQALLRNALATPSILGIQHGGALAILLLRVANVPAGGTSRVVAAFGGAAVVGAIVLAIGAGPRAGGGARLALAGITVGFFVDALMLTIGYATAMIYQEQVTIELGSLHLVTWTTVARLAPSSVVGLAAATALLRPLTVGLLAPDAAAALGVGRGAILLGTACTVLVLDGGVVGAVGPIAFVDLLVPVVVRSLIGPDLRRVVPLSAAIGAALVVWADLFARVLPKAGDGITGIYTAALGVPCLLFLALRKRS